MATATDSIIANATHAVRARTHRRIIPPKPEHGLAEGFLYMLEGEQPNQARIDGLNAYMVAVSRVAEACKIRGWV